MLFWQHFSNRKIRQKNDFLTGKLNSITKKSHRENEYFKAFLLELPLLRQGNNYYEKKSHIVP